MFFKTKSETNYFFKTRFGTLKVCTGSNGLSQVLFEECSQKTIKDHKPFHDTFLQWIREFNNAGIAERWSALSPKGTDFQRTVWRALLEIPFGETISYGTIAKNIHRPKAFRAVGSAIGANPISLLIPCHRVIPTSGGSGNYRWRAERKKALLELESAGEANFIKLFEAV